MFFYYKSIDKCYKVNNEKDRDEIAEITGAYMMVVGLIIGVIYLLSMAIDLKVLLLILLIFIPFFHYRLYRSLHEYKGEKIEEE